MGGGGPGGGVQGPKGLFLKISQLGAKCEKWLNFFWEGGGRQTTNDFRKKCSTHDRRNYTLLTEIKTRKVNRLLSSVNIKTKLN